MTDHLFKPGSWRDEKSETLESKYEDLRERIKKAEVDGNEVAVLLLEAELRALERDEEFDQTKYLQKISRLGSISRPDVLRQLKNDHQGKESSTFYYDGTFEEFSEDGYENTFRKILDELGYSDFNDLLSSREKHLARKQRVLDLFGGAYFVSDLSPLSELIGVRLQNIDDDRLFSIHRGDDYDLLQKIIQSPKRRIIEGDLYDGSTWYSLREIKDKGFDLITCRPMGFFGHDPENGPRIIRPENDTAIAREEIYAMLLDRCLNFLSAEGGILITQVPILGTNSNIKRNFWQQYIELKKILGFKFIFEDDDPVNSETLAVIRNDLD